MSETMTPDAAEDYVVETTKPMTSGTPFVVLTIVGLLAHLAALATVYVMQGADYRLLVLSVPRGVVLGGLATSFALALVHVFVHRRELFVAGLVVLALMAAGVRDVQGADWKLGILLFTFLLAVELPLGANRLRDLRAGIPAQAGKQARRDLASYTTYYLLLAPLTLLAIAAVTLFALRLPDLLLGGFSEKYVEALETRSVFFVIGVTWMLVAPLLGIRALVGLRGRFSHHEVDRPTSPITTGATLLDENTASADSIPLIEVTE